MPSDSRWLVLPVAILALALFALVGLQTFELLRQHEALTALRATQETAVQQSIKTSQQFSALAEKTAHLAASGDAAARKIVDEFQREGVALGAVK